MPSPTDFPALHQVLRARHSNTDIHQACRQLAQAMATVQALPLPLFDILKLIGPQLRADFAGLITLQPADRVDVLRTMLAK